MPDVTPDNLAPTAQQIYVTIAAVSGAALAKVPDILAYLRSKTQDKDKRDITSTREERKAKRDDNAIMQENLNILFQRLQQQCNGLSEQVDELQVAKDECLREREATRVELAETRGEMKALKKQLGITG